MQRQEFVQQLWLDYIHTHPDIGALRLWPLPAVAEYLTLVTLNHGPFSALALSGNLTHMGYRPIGQYAMADKGLLIHLLAPSDNSSWLVLAELQVGALSKAPREVCSPISRMASGDGPTPSPRWLRLYPAR